MRLFVRNGSTIIRILILTRTAKIKRYIIFLVVYIWYVHIWHNLALCSIYFVKHLIPWQVVHIRLVPLLRKTAFNLEDDGFFFKKSVLRSKLFICIFMCIAFIMPLVPWNENTNLSRISGDWCQLQKYERLQQLYIP
jgi:hypothetical protein